MLQFTASNAKSTAKELPLKGHYTALPLSPQPHGKAKNRWRRSSDNTSPSPCFLVPPTSNRKAATINTSFIASHIVSSTTLPVLLPASSSAASSEDITIILSDVDELRKKRKKVKTTTQEGEGEAEGAMLLRSRQRSRSMERVSFIQKQTHCTVHVYSTCVHVCVHI